MTASLAIKKAREMRAFYSSILTMEENREPVPMERLIYNYIAENKFPGEELASMTTLYWNTYFEDYMEMVLERQQEIMREISACDEASQEIFQTINHIDQIETWTCLVELAKLKLASPKKSAMGNK